MEPLPAPVIKRVACIGAGYVGGPSMSCLAYKCPDITVTVLDISPARVAQWNSDQLPIYEPGLLEVVQACRGRNLFFSTDARKHLAEADLIFVCVNTPIKHQGVGAGKAATFGFWEAAARLIASSCQDGGFKIVAEKSPVPVKTAQAMSRVLAGCQMGGTGPSPTRFEVISNPEFMSAGQAMQDLMNPDRVLIGGRETPEGTAAVEALAALYRRWVPAERVLAMGLWSSELAKLAANAFLAQRISSMNAISALCEETGADVQQVAHAIGTDSRISSKYLQAGVGFGGPALQKHVLNLVYICESLELHQVAQYWQQVVDLNDWQKGRFVRRVISSMFNTIRGKRIAVLGFAYKADTTDTRDTAAIDICRGLLQDGAQLAVCDPKVPPEQIHLDMCLPKGSLEAQGRINTSTVSLATVDVARSPYDACRNAHGVCLLTDWPEFRTLDYQRIYDSMMKPAFIFDGRNALDRNKLKEIGFVVYSLGKPLDPFVTQRFGDEEHDLLQQRMSRLATGAQQATQQAAQQAEHGRGQDGAAAAGCSVGAEGRGQGAAGAEDGAAASTSAAPAPSAAAAAGGVQRLAGEARGQLESLSQLVMHAQVDGSEVVAGPGAAGGGAPAAMLSPARVGQVESLGELVTQAQQQQAHGQG